MGQHAADKSRHFDTCRAMGFEDVVQVRGSSLVDIHLLDFKRSCHGLDLDGVQSLGKKYLW